MRLPRSPGAALAVLTVAALAAGCASSSGKTAPASPRPAAHCRGTLGLDVAPMSRAQRKKVGLPKDAKGAVVTAVFPGGPAAAAGIQVNDVIERIGETRIANDCDFAHSAYGLACEPVTVRVWRNWEAREISVQPVDQEPFLEKLCQDKNLDACFRGAWLIWSRDRGDGHAFHVFESTCTAGFAEACAYQGLQLSVSQERSGESVPVLERACELSSGAGCAHLAFLYATGRVDAHDASHKIVSKNDQRATALYRKSCDLGDAQGCYNAALMADEGRGVPRDAARAASEYDEACELGSSTACTNLGFAYENGKGVKQDRARALALYRRGCDGSACQPSNLGGCVNVGRAYRDGIGVGKDEAKAADVFREACDRKENTDDIHAAENGSRACSLLGGLYLSGGGIPQDLAKGRELSELGCERGDSFGCFNAAVVYAGGSGVEKDPARSAGFYDRACKAGDGEACHELAAAYAKGSGVGRDPKLAKSLDQRACELGFAAACPKKPKKKG